MDDKALRILEYNKIISILADMCASALGRDYVLTLRPRIESSIIMELQRETSEAVSIILKKGVAPLGGVQDIKPQLRKAEIGSSLNPGELLKVGEVLRASRSVKNFSKEDRKTGETYPIIDEIINSITVHRNVEDAIFNAILNEEEISDNASTTLKNIRKEINNKNSSMRDKLNSIIQSSQYSKFLQDPIITLRGDRYVVPIKQEYRNSFPGLIHDQSTSGATLFIEPMAVVNMNNDLRQLKIKEKIEIERILMALTEMVAQEVEGIKLNVDLLGQLDFIFAKGKLSIEYNCSEPLINDKGYIRIKNGRHPLIDKKVVVPTNLNLGRDFSSLVITGPNTGGKTVTLKTVGLMVLMAQSGLHLPADYGTEVGVFDQVFADIGDEQSIEQSLSTFSSHMTNIVNILQNITPNSLALFDELGAGTDPTEGAALAMSILDYLHSKKIRTVATTHYSELKEYALTREGVENASVEFDVETLRPTYRLLIGVPGKSNAFEISFRLGLSNLIIDKAREYISQESIRFEDLIAKIHKNREESEKERDEAIRLKIEIEKLKKDYIEKNKRLEDQKEKIVSKARQDAYTILESAKDEADKIISSLRELSHIAEEKDRNRAIEESRKKLRSSLDALEGALSEPLLNTLSNYPSPNKLKPGVIVNIVDLNQKATVLALPDSNGEVLVQAGIMKISVNIKNLRLTDEDNYKDKSAPSKGKAITKSRTISTEIDLRGKTLDEAMEITDKYLDDAYLAGLPQITVIHGKGTGVLMKGIKDLLKHHVHVKSHRQGQYGEGGSGVTIVELK